MRDRRFAWSRAAYRVLLALYPLEFRRRFGGDLEADFEQLLQRRGARTAWATVLLDLVRSVPDTHSGARDTRRRIRAIAYKGEKPMGSLLFDLRHAFRALLKAPVFTSVTIITLALGIGANSAIFSLVNAVLLRPLGYEEPQRLMLIYEGFTDGPTLPVSPPDFVDLVQYQTSFSAIGAYRTQSYELSGARESQQITCVRMSASVFPILGVRPVIGRTFLESEDQPGIDVAVLSYDLWQSRFLRDPAVIGQRISLDRRPFTVIGVMPASFQFPKRGPQFNGAPADLWTPLALNPFERSAEARGMMYNNTVIGRLRDGVSLEQAALDVRALAPRVMQNYPATLRDAGFKIKITAVPLFDEIAGQVQRPLLILLAAVGVVLLIGCANVANLVLSRAAIRQREIGLRAALGAARYRLLQMLLIEGAILSLAGGALGLVIGYWTVRAMPAVIAVSLPGVQDVRVDLRVIAFTFGLSVATALICGIVPLLAGDRRDINDILREGATRSTAGRHRLQGGLVVASVALAFVLLVSAGLLIRSFANLIAVDPGLQTTNVASMRLVLPHADYNNGPAIRTFYRELYERVRAIPGVRAASLATDLPLKEDGERRVFTPQRSGNAGGVSPGAAVTWIHGNYFQTFGIPIARGRAFLPEEHIENRRVAIVSRAIAEQFWPGEDPIGKRVKWGIATSAAPWYSVVGVVGDVVDGGLGHEPIVHIYVPYSEVSDEALASPIVGFYRGVTVAALGGVDASTLAGPMRASVASIDAALAVSDVQTMAQVVQDATAPQRFSTMVLTAFAASALLLAAVGLYGVIAFGVTQRTREIGVRLALGATRGAVLRLVVRQGMTLTLLGAALGVAGALAATRLMAALLYQTTPFDAITFALVPFVLAAVALIACYVPARRAASVEPTVALRTE